MDRVAKHAILAALECNTFITSPFPFELVRVHTGFGKICICGSPIEIEAIYDWHGYNSAKRLFDIRGIVSTQHFDLIFWKGMEKAVKKFPPMFTSWIAKHVSHFCGTNRQLSKMIAQLKTYVQAVATLTKVPHISRDVVTRVVLPAFGLQ